MIEIFNGKIYNFGSSSSIRAIVRYEHARDGSNMKYRFYYKIYVNSGAYYSNNLRAIFTLNNSNVWTKNTQTGSSGWTFEYTSDWFTVQNKISGTVPFKFTIKDTQNAGWCNYTSSLFQLEIDPAGSDLKVVANFDIGTQFNVETIRYSDMYDVLSIKIDSTLIKTIDNATTSNTINFTNEELDDIYDLTTAVKEQSFTFELSTYEDDSKTTQVGVTKTKTAIGYIVNSNPLVNSKAVIDTNTNTTALTGDNTKLVKYSSNALVTVNVSPQHGASISSVAINGNNATLNNNVATITFNSTSTNIFNIVVIDSRGIVTNDSITATMINYVPLTINQVVNRNLPTDNKVKIDYSGNYFNSTFGIVSNSLAVSYRYKNVTDNGSFSNWIALTPSITNNSYSQEVLIDNIDYRKRYEFELKAEDEINIKIITKIDIAKGTPIVNWDDDEFNINGNSKITGNVLVGNLNTKNIWNNGKTITANRDNNIMLNDVLEAGTYTFSFNNMETTSINTPLLSLKNESNTTICSIYLPLQANGSVTFTLTETAYKYRFYPSNTYNNSSGVTTSISDVMIENGDVFTSYTPYQTFIIESGTNENGSWVKYSDGTMECWGNDIFGSSGTNTDSYKLVTYPQAFIDDTTVTFAQPRYTSNILQNIGLFTILTPSNGGTTSNYIYRRCANKDITQTELYETAMPFYWQAKGKWR